jgi:hypothetical protein
MRFYPDIPTRRVSTLARDLLTVALLVLLAWIALKVHDAVDRLAVLGEGVNEAGSSIEDGFESAADAVDGTPIVGGDIADGLRGAGEGSGGNVAELGQEGVDKTHRLADILGLVTFFVPATFLVLRVVPSRIGQVRQLTAAERVLLGRETPEQQRLIAMRAAFALPYGQLLAHTRDPLGDLEQGRYDALVEAVLEDAGLRSSRRKEDA